MKTLRLDMLGWRFPYTEDWRRKCFTWTGCKSHSLLRIETPSFLSTETSSFLGTETLHFWGLGPLNSWGLRPFISEDENMFSKSSLFLLCDKQYHMAALTESSIIMFSYWNYLWVPVKVKMNASINQCTWNWIIWGNAS